MLSSLMFKRALLLALLAQPLFAADLPKELTSPLSIVDALNLAATHNGTILQGQQQIEATYGVAIQTRAIALPSLVEQARYTYRDEGLNDIPESDPVVLPTVPPITLGGTPGKPNNQNWSSDVQIVQSLYEGGRILSAVRSSKLIREQALMNYQATVADILLQVRIVYDDALYASKQIEVRAASVKLLSEQLDLTKKRAAAGVVTDFEVLRAEVELANAQPPLITAQNDYAIAKQKLVQLMGFDLPVDAAADLPLNLSSNLSAKPYNGELSQAVSKALAKRSEIAALEKELALRKESIVSAKAGYKPSLQTYAGYELLSRNSSRNAGDNTYGWSVGGQVSWALFDGFLTKGRVQEARALTAKASEALAEAKRQIALEVRTAWSSLTESKAVLVSQEKNTETAAESLRLAGIRYEAGTGTQIDVLSAQTALTDARVSYVQALRNYSVSRARLERAVGDDLRLGAQ